MGKIIRIFIVFGLVLALSGCAFMENIETFINKTDSSESSESSASESSEEEAVVQEWPVTIEGIIIDEQPESIAVLSPSLYEIMYSMGVDGAVTGVGDYCADNSLPELGTALDPDIEAIIELAPQYLLTSALLPEQELILLQQADIEVIVLEPALHLTELEQLYTDIGLFTSGLTTGTEISAEYWNGCMKLLDEAAEKVKLLENVETALYLRIAELTVATADTLEGELLTKIGFINSAEKYGSWTYPEEDIDKLLPDVIIADSGITEDELEKSDIYVNCPAVKNNMIVRTDMEVFERQSSEMFDALLNIVNELCS